MKKIKLLIALLAFCLGASAQVPIPKFIYCTLGDFPDEISWNIKNCSGTDLLYVWKIIMETDGMVLIYIL